MSDDQTTPAGGDDAAELGPTTDDIDNAATPAPDPAPDPAPAKRSRRTAADEPTDPHAGHAVYDEVLTRYVSQVYRGSSSEADAKAKAAELKKAGGKGSKFTVRPV
jgi:hypothetical protein